VDIQIIVGLIVFLLLLLGFFVSIYNMIKTLLINFGIVSTDLKAKKLQERVARNFIVTKEGSLSEWWRNE